MIKKRKTTITVGKKIGEKKYDVNVGIVSGLHKTGHSHEYQVFDLKNLIDNIGLIGVNDKEIFAIQLHSNFKERYAISVYLDGINISQKNGIISLNEISDEKLNIYSEHEVMVVSGKEAKSTAYLDRYNQISDKNRVFMFSLNKAKSINDLLIKDASLLNRIEIFIWIEKPLNQGNQKDIFFSPDFNNVDFSLKKRSYVGAGKDTNKRFGTTNHLERIKYLGKVMFIHLPADELIHLGEPLISVKNVENFSFNDPMDLIP